MALKVPGYILISYPLSQRYDLASFHLSSSSSLSESLSDSLSASSASSSLDAVSSPDSVSDSSPSSWVSAKVFSNEILFLFINYSSKRSRDNTSLDDG